MDAISSIAGLLSLCGISSVRMFAPAFIFGLICRVMPGYDWCPQGIIDLAAGCPSFLTGDFGLCVFGVLGILEVVANWDDTVREIISEANFEKYVKPVFATIVTYSLCTPEQLEVLSAAVNGLPDVAATAGDPVTTTPAATATVAAAANTVTTAVHAVVQAIDPQVVTNAVETAAAQAAAPAPAVHGTGSTFMALVSSIFCGGGTYWLCKIRSGVIASVRELDPENSLHLNGLLTLAEEGSWLAILPIAVLFPILALFLMVVFAALGYLLSRPLKALAQKRKAHWDSLGRERTVKALNIRATVIFVLGALLSFFPVFGYLAAVIALNLFVFGVIALYEKSSTRIIAKILLRFMKLTLFLIALLFSSIPFLGIVLLLPYLASYLIRIAKLKRTETEARK